MTLQYLRAICYLNNKDSENTDFYSATRVSFYIVAQQYYLRYAKVSCVIEIKWKGLSENLQWINIIQ